MSAGEYKPPTSDSKDIADEAADLQEEEEHEQDDESKNFSILKALKNS